MLDTKSKKTSQIFFSADFHFQHLNANKLCGRPFSSVEEMDIGILNNINNKIQSHDILYFLGDFSFGPKLNIWNFLDNIQCKNIHYIKGNHCRSIAYLQTENNIRKRLLSISNRIDTTLVWHGQKYNFIMTHHPIDSDKRSDTNIYLCGHVHRHNPVIAFNCFDVGVDGHNMQPWSLDELMKLYYENSNNSTISSRKRLF